MGSLLLSHCGQTRQGHQGRLKSIQFRAGRKNYMFHQIQPNGNDSKFEMVPNGVKCTPDLKHHRSALIHYKVATNSS
ncbi:hypothetical protein GOBAR_AA07551 [Gossypium barbadense]|uniref:Uncharacterized protein n=1 Tax=Gossypium barbadense TaxID=3634 RepID=A0A2P5YBX7_GOSBA|nr:hypothetical protein GOBAR_AA07551 [Gossypium barbadense]